MAGKAFWVKADGEFYKLERNEDLEREIMPLVRDALDPNTIIRIVDDRPQTMADAVEMGARHTTTPEIITCPRCNSQDVMKYGIVSGIQQFICNGCHRKFNAKGAPLGMRFPADQIGTALAMFYDGLSLADVSRNLAQSYGNQINPSSIYRWVQRYTLKAIELTGGYKARTGKIWSADETVLGVRMAQTKSTSPNTIWFWDVIDEDSRFLLASHMSNTRTIRDAEALFIQARERASTAPRFVVTDRLAAYIDGIERVWGGDVRHIQSEGMASATHNNIIERFHGTIKERTKVMRDLKSRESALLIMDGWLIHYNFFRPHMSLKGKTPAEAAGIQSVIKSWKDVVKSDA